MSELNVGEMRFHGGSCQIMCILVNEVVMLTITATVH